MLIRCGIVVRTAKNSQARLRLEWRKLDTCDSRSPQGLAQIRGSESS